MKLSSAGMGQPVLQCRALNVEYNVEDLKPERLKRSTPGAQVYPAVPDPRQPTSKLSRNASTLWHLSATALVAFCPSPHYRLFPSTLIPHSMADLEEVLANP